MASRLSFAHLKSAAKKLAVLFVASALFIPAVSFAQIAAGQRNTQAVADAAGISGSTDLVTIIGRIINIFLGLLGVIFLVLILYAGFLWMTAGGDDKKVGEAKSILRNAVIGLVVIVSSWAIVAFIMNALAGATSDGLGGVSGSGSGGGFGSLRGSSGSLGNGIIESHIPSRDATGVPRNTSIIITFKEPIDPSSFISGWTETTSSTTQGLNADAVKIYRTSAGESGALTSDKVRVRYTSDLRTFVIKPVEYLGSPSAKMGYTVSLMGGKSGIRKKDGSAAFSGSFGSGYNWQFEVSTAVDNTPPTVISATPLAFGSYARNVLIQLTFSEAVDPTAVTGNTQNLEVRAGDGKSEGALVPGTFKISNQYRTVEFVPDLKCGMNSCGVDVFCLPGTMTVQVVAKAATLDPGAKPQAQLTTSGYDGVVDAVGNSLDGNGKNGAEGPPTDNYIWSFGTTDLLKLSPPQVTQTVPGVGPGKNSNVPLDQPVTVTFDSILQASTLTTENARITPKGPGETNPDTFWWSVGERLLDSAGADVSASTSTTPTVPAASAIVISHRPYLPSGTGPDKLNFYNPTILSGVQDQYQNCFNPARKCGTGEGVNCCNGQPQDGACVFKP